MNSVPEIRFARQNSHGFRVNQTGRRTYVYGAFNENGSVVVSVFINGEMVFSENITPEGREAKRWTRATAQDDLAPAADTEEIPVAEGGKE